MLPLTATAEQVAELRHHFGLDDPLHIQYGRFLWNAARGDLGTSLWQNVPALPLVVSRLPATLLLAGTVLILATVLGVALGLVAAASRNSPLQRWLTLSSFALVGIPEFWLGLILILVFALTIPILPTSGYGGPQFLVLPALTMMARPLGRITETARAVLIDEVVKGYVPVAIGKGLSGSTVWRRHIAPNAAIPITTIVGDELANLVGGAVVVETVFGWPGIGQLTYQAIVRQDLPLVTAAVVVSGAAVILVNLAVDLAYAAFDPRVRYR